MKAVSIYYTYFKHQNSPTGGALLKPCDYIIKLSVYYGMKKNDNSTPISDLQVKKDFEKDKNMTRHRLLSVGIEEIRLQ